MSWVKYYAQTLHHNDDRPHQIIIINNRLAPVLRRKGGIQTLRERDRREKPSVY
jgi:hypothetical protein